MLPFMLVCWIVCPIWSRMVNCFLEEADMFTEKAQDRILRSGVISRVFDVLTFNDIPLLQQLGLKLLVDFASTPRGVEEILNNAGLGTLLGLVSSSNFALSNSQPPETLLRNLTPTEQSLYLALKILTLITVNMSRNLCFGFC